MNNIVPADEDCLSQDQLSRYVQDDCNLEEMRWIDRHLLRCPLCTDAMEGVMSSDMVDFESVMSRVEMKIDAKIQSNWTIQVDTPTIAPTPNPRWTIGTRGVRWAAAAGLTGIMTLGIWQYNTQNSYKLQETPPSVAMEAMEAMPAAVEDMAAAAPVAPAAPSSVIGKNAPSGAALPPKKAPDGAIASKTVAPNPTQNNESAPPSDLNQSKTDGLGTSIGGELADGYPKKNKVESPIADFSMEKPRYGNIKIEKTQDGKSAEARTTKDIVITKPTAPAPAAIPPPAVYEPNGGYAGAANQQAQSTGYPTKKAKVTPNASMNTTQALYQNAYNSYQQKSYTEAIAGFNLVLGQQPLGESSIYENTLWYLSDAYLQTGDKVKAKALLERIVAEKLQFQRKATQKLNNWKD
ncbi:MAG: hypothetical protein RL329_2906 [Bacteroidota bacterium]|jgi:TolA-binding protein